MVGYGTYPAWARYPHGIEVILWSRRLQWPLVTLSLILCVVMIALVIAGRRRAWWLIGLGPVLALFLHHFEADPSKGFEVVDNPRFVPAAQASLADQDWIVGLSFGDCSYAYPYAQLYSAPVVLQSDHDKRMLLMWSAYGNRAVAVNINRELKARDLEIVGMPANALLLYDSRLGEFINGFKAQTMKGAKPSSFGAAIATEKTTWRRWRQLNPESKVMAREGALAAEAPRGPIHPSQPMPQASLTPELSKTQVIVVGTHKPLAIESSKVGAAPMHFVCDDMPVLLFRDASGQVRAFDRRLDDMRPRFDLNKDRKRAKALFIDRDTGTGWDANGVAVDGAAPYRGRKLARVQVEDGLSWEVLKYWYPGLALSRPEDGL